MARRADYSELVRHDRPDAPVPELIDGEIRYKASPRATHGFTQGRVVASIDPATRDASGGWWIVVEPDVIFAEDRVLRPDLAGWRRDRLAVLEPAPVTLAPDWVCEILSPGHASHDRVTKRKIYADAGVPWLWLVDPEERNVEAFALRDGQWVLLGTWVSGRIAIPPFDSVRIEVEALFTPRRQDEPPLAKEPEVRYRPG